MKWHYPKTHIISVQSLFNSQVLIFGWREVLLGVTYLRSTYPPTRQLTGALADAEESSPNIFSWKEKSSPFPPSSGPRRSLEVLETTTEYPEYSAV